MKRTWKPGGFYSNSRGQFNEADTWVNQSQIKPVFKRAWQHKPATFNQLGYFPTGNDTYADLIFFMNLYAIPLSLRQPFVAMNPPDPDVCIQNDHRRASHSFSSTLSKGSK